VSQPHNPSKARKDVLVRGASFSELAVCMKGLHKSGTDGGKKERKNYASSKKLLTSIKEKGPLGKKSPFTRMEDNKLL